MEFNNRDYDPEPILKKEKRKFFKHKGLDRLRKETLYKKYGLTFIDIARMKVEQNFECAICHKEFKKTPHIDHDHKTGQVRGLLCSSCNFMLGFAKDKIKTLKSGILYLRKNRKLFKDING